MGQTDHCVYYPKHLKIFENSGKKAIFSNLCAVFFSFIISYNHFSNFNFTFFNGEFCRDLSVWTISI